MNKFYLTLFISFLLCISTEEGNAQKGANGDVNVVLNSVNLKLYPNPATDIFSLTGNSDQLQYVTINNIIGKEVRRIKINPNNAYDISDLLRGIYIVRIFNNSDELVKALRLSKA